MLDPLIHGPLLAYLGIVLFITLTGVGLPVPEEVFVVGAAIASAARSLDPWGALAACIAGALLGDSLMYFLGSHFGRKLLNEQHWFSRMLTPEVETHIEQLIQRHGIKMFLVARFLVGLRSPFYITSGILRIGYRRFLLLDSICACTVVGVFFGSAFFLSEHYGAAVYRWIRDAEWFLTGLVVPVVMAVGVYYYICWRRRLAGTASESAGLPNAKQDDSQSNLPVEEQDAPNRQPDETKQLEQVA